jgi:hypothetical protein
MNKVESLQTLIYIMNEDWIRDTVLRDHRSPDVCWLGSFQYRSKLDSSHFRIIGKKRCRYYLFTTALLYEENKIHYMGFVYDKTIRKMICFDPGYNLYYVGEKRILPEVVAIFRDGGYLDSVDVEDRCDQVYYNKRWGIQFNGQTGRLPADAFCQTWSLFFLVSFIKKKDVLFLKRWCAIPPSERERYLLRRFIRPLLNRHTKIRRYFYVQRKELYGF